MGGWFGVEYADSNINNQRNPEHAGKLQIAIEWLLISLAGMLLLASYWPGLMTALERYCDKAVIAKHSGQV